MPGMIFRKTATEAGPPTAICRWKIWCSMFPCPLDEKREYHTIAGLLMEYLQRVPKPGEEVQVGDFLLKTLEVESHRVQKVQLIPLQNEDDLDYEV